MNFGKLYRGSRKLAAKTLPKPALKLIKKVYSFPVVGMGGSLITNERIEVNLSLLERCSELEGDVIECGVYRGGNLIELAKKLKSIESNKVVYGLDTFEGLPFNSEEDEVAGKQMLPTGLFEDTSVESIQHLLDKKGLDNVKLIKGLFSESFLSLKDKKFCFAYIDADLYLSIKQCIDFLKPRMVKGGVIMFDDYNSPTCGGANKAVEEGLGKENLFIFPNKRCYWVKSQHLNI